MDDIAEHALGLLLDNEAVAAHLDAECRAKLGREKTAEENEGEQNDWWDVRTEAMTALLSRVSALNSPLN